MSNIASRTRSDVGRTVRPRGVANCLRGKVPPTMRMRDPRYRSDAPKPPTCSLITLPRYFVHLAGLEVAQLDGPKRYGSTC